MSWKTSLRRANNTRRYNNLANAVLAKMDNQPSDADKRLCDTYAGDVLGAQSYAPWLYVYAGVAGTFREGWIPDHYYKQFVVWPSKYDDLSSSRALAGKLFPDTPIPDFAYIVDGHLTLLDGTRVHPDHWAKALFQDRDQAIFKSDSSLQGLGITFVDRASFSRDTLRAMGSGVFQDVIAQHDMFAELSPNALATLRMTTVLDPDGVASLRGTNLRIGRAGDTHIKSKSGLKIAVDSTTGALDDFGLLTDWNRFSKHPDTGQSFAGLKIPNMAACGECVVRWHQSLPFAPVIGWDIGIDQAGQFHVLEWNSGHVEIKFTEAVQGPWFTDLGWADRWRDPLYQ